ncbi:spry domain-containing socs box protein [Anaeramoeba flamelloides]|uniref:Spry domain-containing socs box protein n=1 Tax=Anaeramoeba flamelloides TaxID=1746091 RepID=A0AAV8A8P1_9EUKA|nr:spry domain-containing socs box protein [Anaeramoeba flamelloides]|eukprot:Anaeramoba_flamelloidesa818519_99.p1 GENE.a818519_99~~a818519_99.p1  ORF type:complete len:181 (+),score=38.81 a818519_99:29-544(+)
MSFADEYDTDEWGSKGSGCQLSNDNKTITSIVGGSTGTRTGKGKLVMESGTGTYRYQIKIDQCHTGPDWINWCCFGVCKPESRGTYNSSDGTWFFNCFTDSGRGKCCNGTQSKYGTGATTGDTIAIVVNMDNKTVSFEKNGKDLGVAHTNIADRVVLCVDFWYSKQSISIL